MAILIEIFGIQGLLCSILFLAFCSIEKLRSASTILIYSVEDCYTLLTLLIFRLLREAKSFIENAQQFKLGDDNGVYSIQINRNGDRAAAGLGSGSIQVIHILKIWST